MLDLDSVPEDKMYGDLGKCLICPNWGFSSLTQQKQHRKLFHQQTKMTDVVPEDSQKLMCNFKINIKICGEVFKLHHILWKHKTNVGDKKNHFEIARKAAEEINKKEQTRMVRKTSQNLSHSKSA